MNKQFRILVPLVAAVLAGCGSSSNEVVCTLEARPAVTVEPINAVTRQPVTGATTLIVREGGYADSTTVTLATSPPLTTLSAAHERAGLYTVVVRNPSYLEYQRAGVRVESDVCHVQTVRLTAELQPRS